MKALILLFSFCATLTFGQTPTEATIIGEWYSCGSSPRGNSLPSSLVLSKKSSPEFSNSCVKDHCDYILIRFESIPDLNAAIVTKHQGCKTDVTNAHEEFVGWTWTLSKDGKMLYLSSEDKKQYVFELVGSKAGAWTLKRI